MAHSGAKTYLPTLLRILARVCSYIIKYRKTIEANIPPEGSSALSAVIASCEALIAIIEIVDIVE